MTGIRPAPVEAKPVPVLDIGDLKKLIRATSGRSFEDIRDTAILRLLIDCGMRRGEIAGLKARMLEDGTVVGDLDFEQNIAWVTGKGNRTRACPFEATTARDLRRYLRIRLGHPNGYLPDLWITNKGVMRDNSILLMVRRRARQAGLPNLFVHQFRHTWAHHALKNGVAEGDLMRLGGWRSREMVSRYGASGADERARAAMRPHSLSDKV
jgi:integrase